MPITQASPEPQSRSAQAALTRETLLATALELFADADFDSVAVAEIAQRAGVSYGVLYHYFGTKRGLYLAAMREAAARMTDAFVVPAEEPAGVQLRVALFSHFTYLANHRGLALRLVLGGRGADPEAWQVFERAREDVLRTLAAVFGLPDTNPALKMIGRTCAGMVDEAAAQWLDVDNTLDLDDVVDWLVHAIAACLRSATALDDSLDLSTVAGALDASGT